jgi:putative transposase
VPDYRRNRVPGGTFFFTANLLDRRSDLLVTQIDALREAVRQVRARAPFHIDAWVVLPDHMHCLWTLPEGDADFPGRWRAIKKGFSKCVPIGEPRSPVMICRGERGIWLRRYWEHTIRDDRELAAHMDYIHFNPVKHGLVEIRRSGRIPPFVAVLPAGGTRRGGCAAPTSRRRRGSGNESTRPRQAQAERIMPNHHHWARRDTQTTVSGGRRCAFPPYACYE